jgi:RNA binding exosome subunit
MKKSFPYIEVSFILHSSEDHDRVLNTISTVLYINSNLFKIQDLEGHFKNKIKLFSTKLLGVEATKIIKLVLESLTESDKKIIIDDLSLYIDENNAFHIRINKQRILQGEFILSNKDPIKIKFKLNNKSQKPISEYKRIIDIVNYHEKINQ